MKIYKYTLNRETNLKLPYNSRVLSVGFQNGDLRMWILLDETKPFEESRAFVCINTGEDMLAEYACSLGFIGTVIHPTHLFVVHVFEGPTLDENPIL